MAKRVRPSSGTKKNAASPASHTLIAPAELDALAELMRRHELGELEIKNGERYVHLVAAGNVQQSAPVARPVAAAPAQKLETATETSDGNVSYITSPFVGSFYRSPNPEAAPFVDVGTKIKKGQVLCIVEAMKLMNEIEAEVDGTIEQILVENGQAVEYGEPLYKLRQG